MTHDKEKGEKPELKEEAAKETAAEREERVLRFWEERQIFQKSLDKAAPEGEYTFYEGPPTANGKPGIHHLEARAFKDVIPRYKTMRGYNVRRKGGWDTHGLPVELQVEKKLGLNSKKAIEEYGIAKFNAECKTSVWEYLEDWNKFTKRIGFWVDQEHPYVTYHNSYIEALWHVLKTVNEKGLLYKDYKVVPWCPRCGTGLSSHELGQSDAYKDVKDLSVYVKFKIRSGLPNVKGQMSNVGEATYLLAWTTTPWTLPGNVALAVGSDMSYVICHMSNVEGGEYFILAKERLSTLKGEYVIDDEFTGADLVGLEYEPLYPFTGELVKGEEKKKLEENAYKVYAADFVTTEDGTGIVHTAVMYGADDFELGTKVGLPKHHLVDLQGNFVPGTGFLEGRFVKDEAVAVDIIKDLSHRGLLFAKEKYEHSYPHCWRCQTPLIYYARDSWYIRMSALREELVAENESINWEPQYIKEGRFGEWLREIKDWAISRERYWGTPLPVWTTPSGKIEVIGSLEDLRARTKRSGNKYFLMRHGDAVSNDIDIVMSDVEGDPLTPAGEEQVRNAARELKGAKIDLIISSDIERSKATAGIVAKELGLGTERVRYDERLREVNFGALNGRPISEYKDFYKELPERFHKAPMGGETLVELKRRATEALYELEDSESAKNILIVSHSATLWMLRAGASGLTPAEILKTDLSPFQNSEVRALDFAPLPHNEEYELDLHRPYVDEIELVSEDGEPMTRVKDVMDVWFDSGAMPFAQDADMRGKGTFEDLWAQTPYPADFIAEAIDQTRGWFYTLHAVGVLMGRGKAYKNVISLGHVLDAKGKKMSKSIGNVVDPWTMIEKYGVDTLRLWMYSVNQPGDGKNFDEKTVAELHNKFFNLLYNVLAFYEQHAVGASQLSIVNCQLSVLDHWILARLDELITLTTEKLDAYRTFEPVRAMREFIDDLSTWYLRRSRDRLKEGDEGAAATLRYVLLTLAKLMAPFAPLAAEDMWLRLRPDDAPESVHLSEWPQAEERKAKSKKQNGGDILEDMRKTREVVSLALEQRAKAGIKVRQPLSALKLRPTPYALRPDFIALIKAEVNVKEVEYDDQLENPVELETTITDELRAEGEARDLVRAIQDARKGAGLQAGVPARVAVTAGPERKGIVEQYRPMLTAVTSTSEIEFRPGEAKGKEGWEVEILHGD